MLDDRHAQCDPHDRPVGDEPAGNRRERGGYCTTLTRQSVPGVAVCGACGYDSYNHELTGGVSPIVRCPSGGDNMAKVIVWRRGE